MNIIKDWLKANKRTVTYLAEEAGVSRQALDGILRGGAVPTLPTLAGISRVTGIPLGDLARAAVTKLPEDPHA